MMACLVGGQLFDPLCCICLRIPISMDVPLLSLVLSHNARYGSVRAQHFLHSRSRIVVFLFQRRFAVPFFSLLFHLLWLFLFLFPCAFFTSWLSLGPPPLAASTIQNIVLLGENYVYRSSHIPPYADRARPFMSYPRSVLRKVITRLGCTTYMTFFSSLPTCTEIAPVKVLYGCRPLLLNKPFPINSFDEMFRSRVHLLATRGVLFSPRIDLQIQIGISMPLMKRGVSPQPDPQAFRFVSRTSGRESKPPK